MLLETFKYHRIMQSRTSYEYVLLSVKVCIMRRVLLKERYVMTLSPENFYSVVRYTLQKLLYAYGGTKSQVMSGNA